MKNLATLPAGAKNTKSPKVEANKAMQDVKLKAATLNQTSGGVTSKEEDEEKYTTEHYTDEYSSVQNKTGMNFNKPPAEVNTE